MGLRTAGRVPQPRQSRPHHHPPGPRPDRAGLAPPQRLSHTSRDTRRPSVRWLSVRGPGSRCAKSRLANDRRRERITYRMHVSERPATTNGRAVIPYPLVAAARAAATSLTWDEVIGWPGRRRSLSTHVQDLLLRPGLTMAARAQRELTDFSGIGAATMSRLIGNLLRARFSGCSVGQVALLPIIPYREPGRDEQVVRRREGGNLGTGGHLVWSSRRTLARTSGFDQPCVWGLVWRDPAARLRGSQSVAGGQAGCALMRGRSGTGSMRAP